MLDDSLFTKRSKKIQKNRFLFSINNSLLSLARRNMSNFIGKGGVYIFHIFGFPQIVAFVIVEFY